MSHPSKQKGNRFEREIVQESIKAGFTSKRAWGSNGKSIGLDEEVDVLIENKAFQCKSRKRLPQVFMIPNSCYGALLKQNNLEPLLVIPFKEYLNLIKIKNNKESKNELPPL